ncbi:MAG: hypothetical protein QW262_08125 [Candidatus Bathyarchaeia archaeon]
MVMDCSRLGQVRIIEAVIAAILIFIAFTAAFSMLFSSEKFFKQETVDLNRLAYNVLHRLAESGVIETAINEGQSAVLANALQSLLPQNVYYNLTIYERDSSGQGWIPVNLGGKPYVSNASGEVFERSSEVASASITYTSKNGKIYYLSLILTRAGLT